MSEFEEGTSADVVYGKPYCRIQSYMVGVFVGYLLYRHMHIKKIKVHWVGFRKRFSVFAAEP